jgi:hypothetical protein
MQAAPPFRPTLTRALSRLQPELLRTSAGPELAQALLEEACRVEQDMAATPASCGGVELFPWRGQPGLTGEMYQELQTLRNPQAAREGQVFTPWRWAERLVALLEPGAGQRWLDPAAGAGIFLQAAGKAGVEPRDCHALEIDPEAIRWGQRLVPGSRWLEGDALADWSQLPDEWRAGFDRVILNPPYRNGVEGRDGVWKTRRAELRRRFETARGPFDLYVPFVERGLEFLRPGGLLGLLVPNTWLASHYGQALRLWLTERAELLRLQHAPGVRLFPRADFEALLLVLRRRDVENQTPLLVERLERSAAVVERHDCPQSLVQELAATGWGPLLLPPDRRRLEALTRPLGAAHEVRASLTTQEFYQLEVRECQEELPAPGELRLLSSGAIEPFHHTWHELAVRFRGRSLTRPVVSAAGLSPERLRQTGTPRVLLANLSRRLEALAVGPDEALGVVNVMQIFCADFPAAQALAAWLNSDSVQAWVRTWHDPLRMNGQLSLSRELVRSLPGPPTMEIAPQARDAESLWHLGQRLAELAAYGRWDQATETLGQVDEIAARWLPTHPSGESSNT